MYFFHSSFFMLRKDEMSITGKLTDMGFFISVHISSHRLTGECTWWKETTFGFHHGNPVLE